MANNTTPRANKSLKVYAKKQRKYYRIGAAQCWMQCNYTKAGNMASTIKPGPMPAKLTKPPKRGTPAWMKKKREGQRQRWGQARENKTRTILRRTRLKPISKAKAELRALYLLALAFLIRIDPWCRRCRRGHATEGHHPWGQIGYLILLFWPFCRACHMEVESNKNKAREEGWLLYK